MKSGGQMRLWSGGTVRWTVRLSNAESSQKFLLTFFFRYSPWCTVRWTVRMSNAESSQKFLLKFFFRYSSWCTVRWTVRLSNAESSQKFLLTFFFRYSPWYGMKLQTTTGNFHPARFHFKCFKLFSLDISQLLWCDVSEQRAETPDRSVCTRCDGGAARMGGCQEHG
jgi:hypothetical protein